MEKMKSFALSETLTLTMDKCEKWLNTKPEVLLTRLDGNSPSTLFVKKLFLPKTFFVELLGKLAQIVTVIRIAKDAADFHESAIPLGENRRAVVRRRDCEMVVSIQTISSSNVGGKWLNYEMTENEIAEMLEHKDDLFTAYSDVQTSIDAKKRVSAVSVTNTTSATLLHFFRFMIIDKAANTLYRDPFGYFDMTDAQIQGDREKANLSTNATSAVVILEERITAPSRLEIMRYIVLTIADLLIRQTRDEQLQATDRETILRDNRDIARETFERLNDLQLKLQAITNSVEETIVDALGRQNYSPQIKVNGPEDMLDVTNNLKSLYLSGNEDQCNAVPDPIKRLILEHCGDV